MQKMPTTEQMKAVLAILNERGFNIGAPWDGDLDDLEMERFNAVQDAVGAAIRMEHVSA